MQLVLAGGFLGAGKTTAIAQACKYVARKGLSAVVITNDQGIQLVDTGFLQTDGNDTLQVSSGCFCCNFDQLNNAIVQVEKANNPDFIFAEPVGSCADLVATVIKPLQQMRPELIINFTVLADAMALYMQFNAKQYIFENNVQYIFDKQLEEADSITITKIDLLPEEQKEKLKAILHRKYPEKTILFQNNYAEKDIERWIQAIAGYQPVSRKSLVIDYEKYGAGEAELAWLDARLVIFAADAREKAIELIENIWDRINIQRSPIGHVKYILKDGINTQKISFTATGRDVCNSMNKQQANCIELLVNARVQCAPDKLWQTVHQTVKEMTGSSDVRIIIKETDYFRPGFPRPLHRIA